MATVYKLEVSTGFGPESQESTHYASEEDLDKMLEKVSRYHEWFLTEVFALEFSTRAEADAFIDAIYGAWEHVATYEDDEHYDEEDYP